MCPNNVKLWDVLFIVTEAALEAYMIVAQASLPYLHFIWLGSKDLHLFKVEVSYT
jgi:hypothetical protein